ncbi:MAG: tRNA (adenosine(37)-N6)-threonylcarbamoyltransferase complex ATPase subunit type 1 TsaE [Bacteroidales bacterium]
MTINFDLGNIDEAAGHLIRSFPKSRIFAFYGEMGSGKTTFIKAVCRYLGVDQFVTSPTFALVNEYRDKFGERNFYHFDFYRVDRVEEAMDMGYEEYFYSNDYCFIEWPEKITELLPDNTVKLKIEVTDNEKRVLQQC